MDTVERFDRVADYLIECFAGGNASVSKDDVIDDDGTVLGAEAFEVLALIRSEGVLIGGYGNAAEALETFVQAWSQGFELASGDDLTASDETVSSVLASYRTSPRVVPASSITP
ncbi:hypothetical protein OIU34_19845 [Pararhizobium sp. BT-229]|uniref:hypothetical protein n=1 Tax=Pararhizobium sp. BT-229 TaxID=2986923 RepID=UPI0021F6C09C|nr:hypothetical protein [Pararhizobium sp. BT-229]MCV9964139.1 hypothetical protein [Pararhizobium sp. BT-229]